jgi:hypothetical protein
MKFRPATSTQPGTITTYDSMKGIVIANVKNAITSFPGTY